MIVRCAPAPFARQEIWRAVTIVAGTARRRLGGWRPQHPNQTIGFRLRVLAAVVVRLPGQLAARHRLAQLGASGQPSAAG